MQIIVINNNNVRGAEEKIKRTVSQRKEVDKVKLAVVAKECRRVQRQLNNVSLTVE
jgi:hypothetical protein